MNWDQNYRALVHFEGARDLYCASGQASEWQSLVGTVRMAHSRKSGFLSGFETDCVPQAAPFLHLRRRGTGAVETVDFLKARGATVWRLGRRYGSRPLPIPQRTGP